MQYNFFDVSCMEKHIAKVNISAAGGTAAKGNVNGAPAKLTRPVLSKV